MSTSWLARLASPGGRAHKGSASRLGRHVERDPLTSFIQAWKQVQGTLNTSDGSRSSLNARGRNEAIKRQLDHMLVLLSAESKSRTEPIGPCLEYTLKEALLSTLVELVNDGNGAEARREIIEWFSRAIIELSESFLAHGGVHKPLIRLLDACVDAEVGSSPEEEQALVTIMVTIAERIRTCPELLCVFLREKPRVPATNTGGRSAPSSGSIARQVRDLANSDSTNPFSASALETNSATSETSSSAANSRHYREHDFLLFTYLLLFVHREGQIGDDARAGLLSLIDIAMGPTTQPELVPATRLASSWSPDSQEAALAFAEFLLDSDFAEVLGAGIAALFGLLPSKLTVRSQHAGSPRKDPWESVVSAEPQTMLLGGLGALGDNEDPEVSQAKLEEEEETLLANGVGIAGTPEFREGLDGWLKLVEFAQEVLKRLEDDPVSDYDAVADAVASRQRLATATLSADILRSLRTLFLQAVLYPSILECSETDGSAVAVMSYLDALLDVVQEGSTLEATVMQFLIAEGEDDPGSKRNDDIAQSQSVVNVFLSPASNRVKRRKSSAMLIIERATHRQSGDYYTRSSRFTLKDLLSTYASSSSQASSIAALKLFRTVLVRHDRWSNVLLDVMLDYTATSFPVMLLHVSDDSDGRPNGDSSDELDIFASSNPTRAMQPSQAHCSPSTLPQSSAPPARLQLDSLDTLLSLLGSIDPAFAGMKSDADGSSFTHEGFSSYLHDAEVAIVSDPGFKRGLRSCSTDFGRTSSHTAARRRRSAIIGRHRRIDPSELVAVETGHRHRLRSHSPFVSQLLDLLAALFSHSPEVNLSLTAALAALAVSPYRSLEDWLLPTVRGSGVDGLGVGSREFKTHANAKDDGDDRSDDDELNEQARVQSMSPSRREDASPYRAAISSSDSALAVLSALVDSIATYSSTIPRFDQYLAERRAGLFFVDNLTDALEHDSTVPQSTLDQAFEPAAPLPLPHVPKSAGFGAFLSPRPSHGRTHSTESFLTPPRQTQSVSSDLATPRTGSQAEAPAALVNQSKGPASPFAAHYRQTSAIRVTPVIVSTPRTASRAHTLTKSEDTDDEDELAPESPTKRLSSAKPLESESISTGEERASTIGQHSRDSRAAREVTLSVILDNVIVLEEFIKELAAIMQVRRSLGIDAARFI